MRMAGTAREEIGSPAYEEALRQEAVFWERVAEGQVDLSLAAWSDPELNAVTGGDLLDRACALAVARGPRVLELACGAGGISMRLAQAGCTAEGIDIAAGLIALGEQQIEARQRQENWPGSARLWTGDLNQVELRPESFDVVLAYAALHHVLDLDHLLTQVHRALTPGGTLICVDHMQPSLPGLLLRYALLLALPTEVPYRRKPLHAFRRLGARFYLRYHPHQAAPAAFTLPEHSPFEDITGAEAINLIRERFHIERYRTYLAFADVVAGHLRPRSQAVKVRMARRLRRWDDWLIQRTGLRGQTYFLVARKS